jgi:hypothetical protein
MDCNFQFWEKDKNTGRDLFVCTKCGYVTEIAHAKRNCVKISQPQYDRAPNLLRKIGNFSHALGGHLYKGMPTVSQSELDERLKICQECPLLRKEGLVGGVCTHENCGCNIKDEVTFLNKIAWADQECPIGKWGKIEKSGV